MKVKKFFIADDDEAIVDATSMMLEMAGYEVRHTVNGNSVHLDVMNKPDLVLLDIWMSGVDGRDICRRLKGDPATLDIPVLMISAGRDIMKSALESGANDFLAKPFDMDELLAKVAKLTGN
jgi:DNA-binding response OmpR family regulator